MPINFRRTMLIRAAKTFDLLVVCVAFVVAYASHSGVLGWPELGFFIESPIRIINVLLCGGYLLFCSLVFSGCNFYRSHRLSSYTARWREVCLAATFLALPLLLLGQPLQLTFATTPFVLTFACLLLGSFLSAWGVGRLLSQIIRSYGRNLRNIIIVGEAPSALLLAHQLRSDVSLGYRVMRVLTDGAGRQELERIITHEAVDEVFVALPLAKSGRTAEQIVRVCEEQGVVVRVWANNIFNLRFARPSLDVVGGAPLVTIQSGPQDGWQLAAKRGLDFLGSALLLCCVSPLFVAVAVCIKLDSPGPIFFRQERVGLNKRRFYMIKFRSMAAGAEQQQQQLESLNEASGPVFKIRSDPRVTRVGKFLRRFSIDELPQLYNVLKGDMSLVGPRPLPVRDVDRMDIHWQKRRFSVKPGLTCLWQTSGRSDVDFDDWVRMDLAYIDGWSLGLDLKILVKTIPAVFKGAGAY